MRNKSRVKKGLENTTLASFSSSSISSFTTCGQVVGFGRDNSPQWADNKIPRVHRDALQ